MLSEVDLTANDRRVIDLVRLVLAKESVKKIIRREEFSEYIDNFTDKDLRKKAFEYANDHLKKYFGMEMIPLPNTPTNFSVPSGSRSKSQKLASASSANQPPTAYILISTLKPEERALIQHNCRNPDKLALLHIVLTLVWLNANRMELMCLRNQLLDCGIVSNSPEASVSPSQLESCLEEWREQKYLAKAKRVDDQVTEFCWGSRAYAEFPVERVADLITTLASAVHPEDFDEKRMKDDVLKTFTR